MTRCDFSRDLLYAWVDGEAGTRTGDVAAHVEACAACQAEANGVRHQGVALRGMIDAAVGQVEPLFAIAKVRERIEQASVRSPLKKLRAAWDELWAYNRRAVAGVALAAALGALTAPFVVFWAKRELSANGRDAALAGVVIESMEWEGDAKAVVYRGQGGATTLIWMESHATANRNLSDTERHP